MSGKTQNDSQRENNRWAKVSCLSEDERAAKIREFLPAIRGLAWKYVRYGSEFLELDDLMSVGTLGLLEALERFDSSRHTSFKTFAFYRVKGAILDEVRKMNWIPRNAYENISKLR